MIGSISLPDLRLGLHAESDFSTLIHVLAILFFKKKPELGIIDGIKCGFIYFSD